jgi:hypothetical protein
MNRVMNNISSDSGREVIDRRTGGYSMTQQQPAVFDLPKVLAVGIVAPAATALTSRFGVAGTLVGLAVSSVLITVGVDLLKVYLARVPGAVTTIPGGLRKKSSLGILLERIKRPFSKLASLSRPRRRSLLIGSLAAAGVSCIVGLILVTVLELGVGKSMSCWVWDDCSTEESSAADSSARTARASTLPTILGGAQSASSITKATEVVDPPDPQQQTGSAAGTPQGAPSQAAPPGVNGAAETPDAPPAAQPAQRQRPSGVAEDQQQSPNRNAPADQQPSSVDQQPSSADYLGGSEDQ